MRITFLETSSAWDINSAFSERIFSKMSKSNENVWMGKTFGWEKRSAGFPNPAAFGFSYNANVYFS